MNVRLKDKRKLHIVFLPDVIDTLYILNTVNALKSGGIQVYTWKEFRKLRYFSRIKIIHFNWIENLDYGSNIKYYFSFFKKIIILSALRILNKKIVWTMNNKISHESKNRLFDILIIKFIIGISNKIHILSNISAQVIKNYYKNVNDKNIFYIPHGNYIPNIKHYNPKKPDGKIKFVFFFLLRPYKNMELLIDVFNSLQNFTDIDFELEITGSGASDEYIKKLMHLADVNNKIVFHFDYIDNDKLNAVIQSSDIAILPFNKISALNSGSIILAFSNKRTVIAPLIGTLQDIKDNFHYFYDYNNYEEHKKALLNSILTVFNDYRNNVEILNMKGEQAYHYVDKYNNWEIIKNRYLELYNSL
jgi:glycosyltransferase involved in cell wall biosynthesis